MKEQNKTPKAWISIRVKPDEYSRIYRNFSETTCSKLSDYVRRVLMQKPVTVLYRNKAADDFLSIFLELKRDYEGVANNFNQAVKRLHNISTDPEVKVWAKHYEGLQRVMQEKMEAIRLVVSELHQQWLQK